MCTGASSFRLEIECVHRRKLAGVSVYVYVCVCVISIFTSFFTTFTTTTIIMVESAFQMLQTGRTERNLDSFFFIVMMMIDSSMASA